MLIASRRAVRCDKICFENHRTIIENKRAKALFSFTLFKISITYYVLHYYEQQKERRGEGGTNLPHQIFPPCLPIASTCEFLLTPLEQLSL